MPLFGGIEAGGTKFVRAVGTGPDDLRNEVRFSTTTPDETIGQTIEYFQEQHQKEALTAIGIASFAPTQNRQLLATLPPPPSQVGPIPILAGPSAGR
jgi:predicted NBD/HSP70 family sugar kinase